MMICSKCSLKFPEEMKICPQCERETIEDRRKKERRQMDLAFTGQERRESERRKQLIKRFEEIFWKGNAKYC